MPEVSVVSTAQDTSTLALKTEELSTVAAWRLALLRAYSSDLTDFNTAVQLKGVTFDNRQVWLQYSI
jgi:hypothetical protein